MRVYECLFSSLHRDNLFKAISNSTTSFQRLQALKKQILSVLKAIRIKVTKDFEFHKKRRIAQS